MTLRQLHRASGALVGLFLLIHMSNHLAGLASIEWHKQVMVALRPLYRNPVSETLLLGAVAFQVISGLRLISRGWRDRVGAVAWSQAISGLYLAAFLTIHVSAVLYGRLVLKLDTHFDYAAAGMHVPPYGWFFAPYYGLAVFSLGVHLGCAWYWHHHTEQPGRAHLGWRAGQIAGAAMALTLVALLAGWIHPVHIPAAYLATYGAGP